MECGETWMLASMTVLHNHQNIHLYLLLFLCLSDNTSGVSLEWPFKNLCLPIMNFSCPFQLETSEHETLHNLLRSDCYHQPALTALTEQSDTKPHVE